MLSICRLAPNNRNVPPVPLMWLILAVAVAMIIIIALASGARRKTSLSIEQVFQQAGLVRQSKPFASGADFRWHPFASLSKLKGGPKRVTWLATGTIEARDVFALEHRYVVSTGQVTAVITHTVVACRCPSFWPSIDLQPETVFHRLADRLGLSDVEVESERFNRRWRVKTSNPDLALAIFTPESQSMLENAPRAESWTIGDGWIRVVRRAAIKPDDLPGFLRRPVDLLACVPPEMHADASQH